MKVLILLVCVGLALGAVVVPPKQKVHNNVGEVRAVIASSSGPVWQIKSDWLSDLIEAILGKTVVEFLNLINDTMIGSDYLVKKAVAELQKIMEEVAAEIKQELEAIIDEALEKALEIMQPILDKMGRIIPILNPRGKGIVGTELGNNIGSVSDLILAILGITLEELLTGITDGMYCLNDVLNDTLAKLLVVAGKVSEIIAEKLNQVIQSTLTDAQELVKPLLDMLEQIFGPSRNIINELIQAFWALDFESIFKEQNIALPKVQRIGLETLYQINEIFKTPRPELREEVKQIIESSNEERAQILHEFFEAIKELLPSVSESKAIISTHSNQELIALTLKTFRKLDQLKKDTIVEVLEVANKIGAETSARVQIVIQQSSERMDEALEPLLILLKPFLDVLNSQNHAPIRVLSCSGAVAPHV